MEQVSTVAGFRQYLATHPDMDSISGPYSQERYAAHIIIVYILTCTLIELLISLLRLIEMRTFSLYFVYDPTRDDTFRANAPPLFDQQIAFKSTASADSLNYIGSGRTGQRERFTCVRQLRPRWRR
jgi:hypothetical protein